MPLEIVKSFGKRTYSTVAIALISIPVPVGAVPMDLTDDQWQIVKPLIPAPPRRSDGRGRPWRATRDVLDGILWILRTGAPWKDLPKRYPPYQTCHRRFQRWARDGTLSRVLRALAHDLKERGGLDLEECFIDGTFVAAKKGGRVWERPSGAKVRRSWQWQTVLVFLSPVACRLLRRTK
jgi:transposase